MTEDVTIANDITLFERPTLPKLWRPYRPIGKSRLSFTDIELMKLCMFLSRRYDLNVVITEGGGVNYSFATNTIHIGYRATNEPEYVHLMRGYIDHEIGHVRHSRKPVEVRRDAGVTSKCRYTNIIHNVLEDARVDRLSIKDFAGTRQNLRRLWEVSTQPGLMLANIFTVILNRANSVLGKELKGLACDLLRSDGRAEFDSAQDVSNLLTCIETSNTRRSLHMGYQTHIRRVMQDKKGKSPEEQEECSRTIRHENKKSTLAHRLYFKDLGSNPESVFTKGLIAISNLLSSKQINLFDQFYYALGECYENILLHTNCLVDFVTPDVRDFVMREYAPLYCYTELKDTDMAKLAKDITLDFMRKFNVKVEGDEKFHESAFVKLNTSSDETSISYGTGGSSVALSDCLPLSEDAGQASVTVMEMLCNQHSHAYRQQQKELAEQQQSYMGYSTTTSYMTHPIEKHLHHDEDRNRVFDYIEKQHARHAKRSLLRYLKSEAKSGYDTDKRRGLVDPGQVAHLASGTHSRCMQDRTYHLVPKTLVGFLMDVSGSMQTKLGYKVINGIDHYYNRMCMTAAAVSACASLVSSAGHDIAIDAFTDRRLEVCRMGEKYSRKTRDRLRCLRRMSDTNCHFAILHMLRQMVEYHAERKVMMVYTDGGVDVGRVKPAIDAASAFGIEVIFLSPPQCGTGEAVTVDCGRYVPTDDKEISSNMYKALEAALRDGLRRSKLA